MNVRKLLLRRTNNQHIRRVEEISPLTYTSERVLVAHSFPVECQLRRSILSGAQLKAAGAKVPPLGSNSRGTSKFNVDGLLNHANWNEISTYSQIVFDRHAEGLVTRIAWEHCRDVNEGETPPKYLRETTCEVAVVPFFPPPWILVETMGFERDVWCFNSAVDCENARVRTRTHWHDEGRNTIDRSPAHWPEFIIQSKDDCAEKQRGCCDSLWQSGGLKASPLNFDEDDKYRAVQHQKTLESLEDDE